MFLTIFLGVLLSCNTSYINVVKVDNSSDPSKKEGIYYNLPKTIIIVDVTVTKEEKIKGPYAEFAGKYLGMSNVITQNSTTYNISGISLSSSTSPDTTQYYYIHMGKKALNDNSFQLALSETGIIQNTTGEQPAAGVQQTNITMQPEESNIYPDVFKYFSDLNLHEQVDTIIETVNLDSITIEKITFKRKLVEKTPEQKAKDAADFIIKVKENRFNLISGYQEVNYNKETFNIMNQEMLTLENEYCKLFTGLTFTNDLNYRFTFVPNGADSLALFKFSGIKGVIDTSSINGQLVYLTINRSNDTQPIKSHILRKEGIKTHGLYYRIPEAADISIYLGNKLYMSGKFLINQYGAVSWLPANDLKVKYYPSNGSIKNINLK